MRAFLSLFRNRLKKWKVRIGFALFFFKKTGLFTLQMFFNVLLKGFPDALTGGYPPGILNFYLFHI